MAIPDGVQSITTEWLTYALGTGTSGSDATVSSFRAQDVGGEHGWIGQVARLQLSYSDSTERALRSVIVKFSPPDPNRVFSNHEVRFYSEIAPGHGFAVPKCYYGEVDSRTGASVLLLEDMSRLRTVGFVDGCTVEEAEAAVMSLAQVHSTWWEDARLHTKDWMFTIADTEFSDWWRQYPEAVRTLLPELEVSSGLMEFGDRFAADVPGVLDRIEGSPFTAIHRDIHVDNLLFGSEPEDPPVVLIDWQTAGRGLGISDIAYLLISSLSPQDRRTSERRLVSGYHQRLIDNDIDSYSFDQCWADYKLSVASKLFITVTATVRLDNTTPHRRAWRAADLKRLMAFVEDHDPIREI